MPRPTPSPSKRTPPAERRKAASANPNADVDPRWLLQAGAICVLIAIVCGYLTLCLLFYQGQWQLVLHPKRDNATTSQLPVADAAAELIHFGPDDSAVPQLVGWWIPATPGSICPRTEPFRSSIIAVLNHRCPQPTTSN